MSNRLYRLDTKVDLGNPHVALGYIKQIVENLESVEDLQMSHVTLDWIGKLAKKLEEKAAEADVIQKYGQLSETGLEDAVMGEAAEKLESIKEILDANDRDKQ